MKAERVLNAVVAVIANIANNVRPTAEPNRIVGRAEIYLGLVRAASPYLFPMTAMTAFYTGFLALYLVKLVLFMTL